MILPWAVVMDQADHTGDLPPRGLTRPAPARLTRFSISTSPPPTVSASGTPDVVISPDGTQIVLRQAGHQARSMCGRSINSTPCPCGEQRQRSTRSSPPTGTGSGIGLLKIPRSGSLPLARPKGEEPVAPCRFRPLRTSIGPGRRREGCEIFIKANPLIRISSSRRVICTGDEHAGDAASSACISSAPNELAARQRTDRVGIRSRCPTRISVRRPMLLAAWTARMLVR